jgi:hypothetical protein
MTWVLTSGTRLRLQIDRSRGDPAKLARERQKRDDESALPTTDHPM